MISRKKKKTRFNPYTHTASETVDHQLTKSFLSSFSIPYLLVNLTFLFLKLGVKEKWCEKKDFDSSKYGRGWKSLGFFESTQRLVILFFLVVVFGFFFDRFFFCSLMHWKI